MFSMHESGVDLASSGNSYELLEAHQANEQKRLLQRFKELRQWQQQQQEQLMLQQKLQLKAWQEEQNKVQTMIATQQGASWNQVLKPNRGSHHSPVITPPVKRFTDSAAVTMDSTNASLMQTAGASEDSGLASMQDTLKSQGTLPKPIMYEDPSKLYNPNDEDRYTSSELFSNPGSNEDQMEILKDDRNPQVPDWMSDSSENFMPLKLPPPRPLRGGGARNGFSGSGHLPDLDQLLSTVPAGILQQVLSMLPGKARPGPSALTADDVELSASPTLPGPGQQPRARKLQFVPVEGRANVQSQEPLRHQSSSQVTQLQASSTFKFSEDLFYGEAEVDAFVPRAVTFDDGVVDCRRFSEIPEEDEEDAWNGEEGEEDDEEGNYSDNDYGEQDITAKEISSVKPDDRPINGAGDTKSFEQLLEEKLRLEEEKSRSGGSALGNTEKKKSFLRKGDGISRFKGPPPKRAQKKKSGAKSVPHRAAEGSKTKENSRKTAPQQSSDGEEGSKKASVGSRLKTLSKSSTNLPNLDRKVVSIASKAAPQDRLVKPARVHQEAAAAAVMAGDPPKTSGAHPDSPLKSGPGQQQCPANMNLIRSAALRKHEEQRARKAEVPPVARSPGMDHINQIRQHLLGQVGRSPSLESRSTQGDTMELDSLAEFELMEDAMDNISFCSNSSLMKKFLNSDKQQQKEAIDRIKLMNEKQKLSEGKNGGDSDEDTLREIEEEDVEDGDTTEPQNSNNNNKVGFLKSSSDTLNNHENVSDIDERTAPSGESNHPASFRLTGSSDYPEPPLSPSKVMTRKIAPMTSKFSVANDTLSMLKALSAQAGILTSATGNGLKFFPPLSQSLSASQPNLITPALDSIQSTERDYANNFNSARRDPQQPLSKHQFSASSNTEAKQASGFQNGYIPSTNPTRPVGQKFYDSQRYGVLGAEDGDDSSDYNQYEESDASEVDEESSLSEVEKDEAEREQPNGQFEKHIVPSVKSYDDESSWADERQDEEETCINPLPANSASTNVDPVNSTPPTSKLVSRLFPKLKPKPTPQEEKNMENLQRASAQPPQSDGVQSRILRDKLKELELEIEKFRSENANLEKLRREREEGLAKLKQEIETFQKEKETELKRLEEFKAEEMKKLKRERKLFDNYQSKIRSMPDKKDREEIEHLRNQLQEMQDELKRKESRWNSSTARLKNRLAEVELENGELKEEVRILEKRRLEWVAAQAKAQTNGKVGSSEQRKSISPTPRSSTPTKEIGRTKSGHSFGNKELKGQAAPPPKSDLTSSLHAVASTGSKKKNNAEAGGKVFSNGQPSATATVSKPAESRTPSLPANILGESIQTQNTSVPVMMDNTLPSCTQASSMPGIQNYSSPSPGAKSAALIAMEKAVVDKGDITLFKESRHPEGKVEKTYRTGAKEIHFPNGTVKEISADGQTIICRLANGDVRQIFPDHRVVYIFAEAEILQTTFSDGLETFEFKNGQTEKRYPDGTVEIIFPSKDVKYLFPDGGQEVILTNGTVMQYNNKGERTVEYPSGDREIHTAEYQRREFPDGIIKTVYADGRHETRFPNGRVRLRDKAGNVIMDQIVYR